MGIWSVDRDFLEFERRKHRTAVEVFCVLGVIYAFLALYVFGWGWSFVVTILEPAIFFMIVRSPLYLKNRFIDAGFLLFYDITSYLDFGETNKYLSDQYLTQLHNGLSESSHLIATNTAIFIFFFAIICIGDTISFAFLAVTMTLIAGFSIYQLDGLPTIPRMAYLFFSACGAIYSNYIINKSKYEAFNLSRRLQNSLDSFETKDVIERVERGDTVADSYPEISIIFIDMVGFTQLTQTISAKHVLMLLNDFFGAIDQCAKRHEIEKVKTIGDAYFAVAGARTPLENPADAAIAFAKEVVSEIPNIGSVRGQQLNVRIGIHTASAIGGVIGKRRWSYDYWGESVNLASRIQSNADINSIFVSKSTFHRSGTVHQFAEPQVVDLKGIGATALYQVIV